MNRRGFLGTAALTVDLPLALTRGLMKPARVLAEWPADAFHATNLDVALGKLFPESKLEKAVLVQPVDCADYEMNCVIRELP